MKNKIWEYESNNNDRLAKQVEKNNDIVMTNPTMAIYLISTIPFIDGDVVIEPCKGTGSFYDNLPSNTIKKYCEINEGIDYLEFNEMVDYTISNPPFIPRKLFWEFNKTAMNTTRKEIYWLISLISFNVFTPKRLEEMKNKGWYINNFHIVSDKRWFGRYVWLRITREDKNFIKWCGKSF